jgi:hypothetical protein
MRQEGFVVGALDPAGLEHRLLGNPRCGAFAEPSGQRRRVPPTAIAHHVGRFVRDELAGDHREADARERGVVQVRLQRDVRFAGLEAREAQDLLEPAVRELVLRHGVIGGVAIEVDLERLPGLDRRLAVDSAREGPGGFGRLQRILRDLRRVEMNRHAEVRPGLDRIARSRRCQANRKRAERDEAQA